MARKDIPVRWSGADLAPDRTDGTPARYVGADRPPHRGQSHQPQLFQSGRCMLGPEYSRSSPHRGGGSFPRHRCRRDPVAAAALRGSRYAVRLPRRRRGRRANSQRPSATAGGPRRSTPKFCLGPTSGEPRFAARVAQPASGRVLELFTNQPGLQVYSGNFLDGSTGGKGGRLYRQSDAMCLEPHAWPDTPNRPDFPTARLLPGEVYRHATLYRFTHA